MIRLVRQWSRWVIGAWVGSSVLKVEAQSGIEDLTEFFKKKKIRWAASVYGRHLPILGLRDTAQTILTQAYIWDSQHPVLQWNWMTEFETCPLTDRKEVMVREWHQDQTEEYRDRSRVEEAAAGATTRETGYLGKHATVMDAEILGISLALESGRRNIALDSQAAITRNAAICRTRQVMGRA